MAKISVVAAIRIQYFLNAFLIFRNESSRVS